MDDAFELPDWVEHIPRGTYFEKILDYYLVHVLLQNNGNRTYAAKEMGMSLRTLRWKLRRLQREGYMVPTPQKGVSAPRKRSFNLVYRKET